jgi:hypothetical protein
MQFSSYLFMCRRKAQWRITKVTRVGGKGITTKHKRNLKKSSLYKLKWKTMIVLIMNVFMPSSIV